jgi:glycosyltransferase involved in cell wall biosynthesis
LKFKEPITLLSIIVPTLNESKTGYLSKILNAYLGVDNIELICVDGGSKDDTISLIKQSNAKLIATDVCSRAGRLNAGVKQAKFDLVLLHHPRSLVDIEGLKTLINRRSEIFWGAFTHQFSISHPLLYFTSWYSNHIRGGLRGIYYLDHCLFAQKQLLLDVGLLPEIDIFEDTEICLRLRQRAKPIRLPFISQTSAVRFQANGMYRQALKNQYLKWLYYFKRSDTKMNKLYEKGINLNTQYDKKNN